MSETRRKPKPPPLERIIQGWPELNQMQTHNMASMFDYFILANQERDKFHKANPDEHRIRVTPYFAEAKDVNRFLLAFADIYTAGQAERGPLHGVDEALDELLCTWRKLADGERKAVARLARQFAAEPSEITDDPARRSLLDVWEKLNAAQRGILAGMAQDMANGAEPEPPKPAPKPLDDEHRVSFRKLANALVASDRLTDAELGKFLRVVRSVVFAEK